MSGGNQLEEYLLRFNETPSRLKTWKWSSYCWWFPKIAVNIFTNAIFIVLRDFLSDTAACFYWCGTVSDRLYVKMSSTRFPFLLREQHSSSLFMLIIRRCVMLYLLVCSYVFQSNVFWSFIRLLCGRSFFIILLVSLTFGPLLLGSLLHHVIGLLLGQAVRAENNALMMLHSLKKVQMVAMGRELSHPMPSISKLEQLALESDGGIHVLSCSESRRALAATIQTLRQQINLAIQTTLATDHAPCDLQVMCSSHQIAALASSSTELTRAIDDVFRNELPVFFHGIYQLVCIRHCNDILKTSADPDVTEQLLSVMGVIVMEFLRLPWILTIVHVALVRFNRRLLIICRDLQPTDPIHALDPVALPGRQNDMHAKATLDPLLLPATRLELLRLRLRLEDVLNRIWLSEKELVTTENISPIQLRLQRSIARLHGIAIDSSTVDPCFSAEETTEQPGVQGDTVVSICYSWQQRLHDIEHCRRSTTEHFHAKLSSTEATIMSIDGQLRLALHHLSSATATEAINNKLLPDTGRVDMDNREKSHEDNTIFENSSYPNDSQESIARVSLDSMTNLGYDETSSQQQQEEESSTVVDVYTAVVETESVTIGNGGRFQHRNNADITVPTEMDEMQGGIAGRQLLDELQQHMAMRESKRNIIERIQTEEISDPMIKNKEANSDADNEQLIVVKATNHTYDDEKNLDKENVTRELSIFLASLQQKEKTVHND